MQRCRSYLWLTAFFCASLLPAQGRPDFTGSWEQNNERCDPKPANTVDSYRSIVEQRGATLTVKTTVNHGHGLHQQSLTFQIDGDELIYTGSDGDEFHTRVSWDGESLIFDTDEHEKGREIRSKETWTLIDGGKSLRRVRESKDRNVTVAACVLEKR